MLIVLSSSYSLIPIKHSFLGWCIFCFGEEFWKKVEAAQIELGNF